MSIRRFALIFACLTLVVAGFFVVPGNVTRAECGVTHTVLQGQNLFRISLRYGVTMSAIAKANNLANVNRIYAGQSLYIPCATGSTTTTTTTTTTTSTGTTGAAVSPTPNVFTIPSGGTIDCTGFKTTSPLDGLPDGQVTFYWNQPASGKDITHYQVIVQDDKGRRIAAFETAGGFYNVTGNVSFNAIGGRSRFSWFAIALAHGVEACRSQVTILNRVFNANAGLSP